jgi:aquaporin Z
MIIRGFLSGKLSEEHEQAEQPMGCDAGAQPADGVTHNSLAGMLSAFLIETVLTAIFLFVIMGATDGRAPAGFAPIAIGLCLTLIHLISIPVTNTSVNPARSTAMAVFVGGAAIKQLWLFWVAPILGGVIGGIAYKCIAECKCCKK